MRVWAVRVQQDRAGSGIQVRRALGAGGVASLSDAPRVPRGGGLSAWAVVLVVLVEQRGAGRLPPVLRRHLSILPSAWGKFTNSGCRRVWFGLASKAGPGTGRPDERSGPQPPFPLLEMLVHLSDDEIVAVIVTVLSSLLTACFVWGAGFWAVERVRVLVSAARRVKE